MFTMITASILGCALPFTVEIFFFFFFLLFLVVHIEFTDECGLKINKNLKTYIFKQLFLDKTNFSHFF